MNDELKWQAIKNMLKSGMKPTEVAKCGLFNVTAGEIYKQQKIWGKEAYRKDPKYQDPKYKQWRMSVLKRDKSKCVVCKRGRNEVKILQVDHIKSWSRFPELRYTVSNGRTLCLYHHKRTLNYGTKANTCDDTKNGKIWELREKILWNKKLAKAKLRKQAKAK